MQKIAKRLIIVIPAVLLQLGWFYILSAWLSRWAVPIGMVLTAISFVLVIFIMTKRDEGAYKMLWLLVILLFPVPGTILYLLFGNKRTTRPLKRRFDAAPSLPSVPISDAALSALETTDKRMAQTFCYVERLTGASTHFVQETRYFSLGDTMFPAMLAAVEKAQEYIFAEYFIVERGEMWDALVEVMARKVSQGVDVRIMYDDLGSLSTYDIQGVLELKEKGIRCIAFNPLLFVRGTIELLSQATQYAWFFTPYLLPGDALLDALLRAAERGVDVRIIMPGIPDKKIVFRMAHGFYPVLLKAGVKIYEYTPGFVHAKGCVVDDVVGTVGTVNLDYRSLFLHFENNSLFYGASLLADLKADFEATQAQCRQMVLGHNVRESFGSWLVNGVLRLFAPLC